MLIRGIALGLLSLALGCSSGGSSEGGDMSGPASSLEICHATCQFKRTCTPSLASGTCDANCDAMAGALQDEDNQNDKDCSNAASVRQQQLDCLSLQCDMGADCPSMCAPSQSCTDMVNTTCVPR